MKSLFRLFTLVLVFASLTYAQTGTRLVDFNAKSMGRGGTSIGTFDSPDLMMTNPAGIGFLKNSVIDANFALMFPSLHFKNNLNDVDGDKNIFPLPSLSYVNKYGTSNFTWGVGFFTSGGMGADYKLKHALYKDQSGNFQLQEYHSQLAAMQGGVTAAYKFSEQFSVGVSLHLVYSMLEFAMPYSLNPSLMKGTAMPGMTFGQMFAAPQSMGGFGYTEVTASAKMSDLTGIGFNGKIGLAYKVNDQLSIGVSYTLPTSLTYENGKAAMDMTVQLNDAFALAIQGYLFQNPGKTVQQAQAAIAAQFSQLGIDLTKGVAANYDLSVDLTFPQSFGFGLSYKASDCINLSGDFEWINWENAFDKMTLKMTNGTNSNVNKMMGSSAFNIDFPMNWKNSILVKVGGEYMASKDLTLRLGYAYGSNPVPEATIFPIFPAIVESHLTVGCSYKISKPLTINAAFETALNNAVTAANPSLIAKEYNGSTSELSTMLIHVGVSYGF